MRNLAAYVRKNIQFSTLMPVSRFPILYPHGSCNCSCCSPSAFIDHLLCTRHGILTHTICDIQEVQQERSLLFHVHVVCINSVPWLSFSLSVSVSVSLSLSHTHTHTHKCMEVSLLFPYILYVICQDIFLF